jgi:hypothetical protein
VEETPERHAGDLQRARRDRRREADVPQRLQYRDGWLDGSLGAEALKPAAEEKLREHLVSPRLNRTGFGDDDPTIIEPVGRNLPH